MQVKQTFKNELEWAVENLKSYHLFDEKKQYAIYRFGESSFKEKMKHVSKSSGAYLVLAKDGKTDSYRVVYIGSSGKFKNDKKSKGASISVRKNGLYARLVNGRKNKKKQIGAMDTDNEGQ